jgi:UDP-glucuronate 4-epimerase
VVGLDDLDAFYEPATKERNLDVLRAFGGFTDVRGDVRDPQAWAALPDGVEAVVHLAARAGVRPSLEHPALYADVNVVGTARMLAFARAGGVRAVVFASSSSVYGDASAVPFREDDPAVAPLSPYAATKRAGELLCHAAHEDDGVSIAALRLFTVHGPRQRPDLAIHKFARLLADGRPLPRYGDGSSSRDFTYVSDIVTGIRSALALVRARPGLFEVVNLGGGDPVTLADLITMLGEEMGVLPTIEPLPMQTGDVRRTWADLERARALLGYAPEVPLREGVRRFVRWFEAERAARGS